MANIKIADKPTLDTVKTNTDTTNTKLGNTADSGASASTGSVNGKLNKIITDASTTMGYVMAGEGVTGTISTATVTATASGTKRARVGSFTLAHAGEAEIVISASGSGSGTMSIATHFFVSTTSTSSPSATTESEAVAVTQTSARLSTTTATYYICPTTTLNAGTYYVYVTLVNSGSSTPSATVSGINASVSYATSTRCTSVVKSVQSGIYDPEVQSGAVTIQAVSTDKSIVLINGACEGTTFTSVGCKLTATKLFFFKRDNVGTSYSGSWEEPTHSAVSWQVIEFY